MCISCCASANAKGEVSSVSLRLTSPSAEGAFWRTASANAGRGVSSVMRANAHDSSFCGRSLGGTRLRTRQRALRSPFGNLRPIAPPTMWRPTSAGHGGSVSRRDHNQAYRRRAHLSGGTKPAESHTPNASRSSGEGVWGRGASLREAASPPASPIAISSKGGAGENASL